MENISTRMSDPSCSALSWLAQLALIWAFRDLDPANGGQALQIMESGHFMVSCFAFERVLQRPKEPSNWGTRLEEKRPQVGEKSS